MGCGLNKKSLDKPRINPLYQTERVIQVLSFIDKNKLNHYYPDSVLYPNMVQNILYQGANQTGNEFAEYTDAYFGVLSADTYHTLSVQNLKNGNYAQSHKYISKAVEMDPKEHAGYYGWVLLYYYRDYTKSLKFLNVYDAFTPNFSDFPVGESIHYLKGLAYMQLNELDSALIEFDRYILAEQYADAENFIDIAAFVNKGRVLAKQNKREEAIAVLQKAISIQPQCVEAYYYLTENYLQTGQNSEALVNVELAIDLFHNYHARDVYVELFHEVYLSDLIRLREAALK